MTLPPMVLLAGVQQEVGVVHPGGDPHVGRSGWLGEVGRPLPRPPALAIRAPRNVTWTQSGTNPALIRDGRDPRVTL